MSAIAKTTISNHQVALSLGIGRSQQNRCGRIYFHGHEIRGGGGVVCADLRKTRETIAFNSILIGIQVQIIFKFKLYTLAYFIILLLSLSLAKIPKGFLFFFYLEIVNSIGSKNKKKKKKHTNSLSNFLVFILFYFIFSWDFCL